MRHPINKVLLSRRCKLGPHWRKLTIEEGSRQGIQVLVHTDLTVKCALQLNNRAFHLPDQFVETFKLLEKHSLCGRRVVIERLADIVFVERLWDSLVEQVVGDLHDLLFLVDATTFAAFRRLHVHDVEPKGLGSVVEVRDLSIRVETEDARSGEERDVVNELKVLLESRQLRDHVVVARAREVVPLVAIEDEGPEILFQIGDEHASIESICHSAAVHCISNQVAESLPRQLFVIGLVCLCQVHANETEGNLEVRLVEVVVHIPADLAELLALLDDRMEEGQHIEHRLELFLGALVENVF